MQPRMFQWILVLVLLLSEMLSDPRRPELEDAVRRDSEDHILLRGIGVPIDDGLVPSHWVHRKDQVRRLIGRDR